MEIVNFVCTWGTFIKLLFYESCKSIQQGLWGISFNIRPLFFATVGHSTSPSKIKFLDRGKGVIRHLDLWPTMKYTRIDMSEQQWLSDGGSIRGSLAARDYPWHRIPFFVIKPKLETLSVIGECQRKLDCGNVFQTFITFNPQFFLLFFSSISYGHTMTEVHLNFIDSIMFLFKLCACSFQIPRIF